MSITKAIDGHAAVTAVMADLAARFPEMTIYAYQRPKDGAEQYATLAHLAFGYEQGVAGGVVNLNLHAKADRKGNMRYGWLVKTANDIMRQYAEGATITDNDGFKMICEYQSASSPAEAADGSSYVNVKLNITYCNFI